MDPVKTMRDMKKFVADNLQDCCAEIIEWKNTADLRGGKIQQASNDIRKIFKNNATAIVESEVAYQAMKKVANES